MTKYKITQKQEDCIGCGACVAVCPKFWKMNENGKAEPIKTEFEEQDLECNKEAAESCPVEIIKIS